jgi:hypothetical protein
MSTIKVVPGFRLSRILCGNRDREGKRGMQRCDRCSAASGCMTFIRSLTAALNGLS